ncbi:hypothetical protein K503DRAFT_804526 [Rhizopogon vinicolor AM-OR11-026]|uniref:superoxide dismutase n=1 Tax=Rhizopogon vinicolor AM-OR11-026 TaxID=1314800 RepID=A0A1B7MKY2_9AGAM|nr:hypothetical protein K503DRAFT_804526 [Rhizopogon vinicolor AM-OR11-026]
MATNRLAIFVVPADRGWDRTTKKYGGRVEAAFVEDKKYHHIYVDAVDASEASYTKGPAHKECITVPAALKFNSGGVISSLDNINHSVVWKNLAPTSREGKRTCGSLKPCPLKQAIDQVFGSFDELKKQFGATTAAIQGSG